MPVEHDVTSIYMDFVTIELIMEPVCRRSKEQKLAFWRP